MPVKLPENYPLDHDVLSLLKRIASVDGALVVSDEDFLEMERETPFRQAEGRGLLRVDQGGEWTAGAVLSLTEAGRKAVGLEPQPGLFRFFERLLRRSRPRAHG